MEIFDYERVSFENTKAVLGFDDSTLFQVAEAGHIDSYAKILYEDIKKNSYENLSEELVALCSNEEEYFHDDWKCDDEGHPIRRIKVQASTYHFLIENEDCKVAGEAIRHIVTGRQDVLKSKKYLKANVKNHDLDFRPSTVLEKDDIYFDLKNISDEFRGKVTSSKRLSNFIRVDPGYNWADNNGVRHSFKEEKQRWFIKALENQLIQKNKKYATMASIQNEKGFKKLDIGYPCKLDKFFSPRHSVFNKEQPLIVKNPNNSREFTFSFEFLDVL